MDIGDTYSQRRLRQQQAEQQQPFIYHDFPQRFLGQVAHIWVKAIGGFVVPNKFDPYGQFKITISNEYWVAIVDYMREEQGLATLGSTSDNPFQECQRFLFSSDENGKLDIIEVSFRLIDTIVRYTDSEMRRKSYITISADDAITRLNVRFHEHNLGYQYIDGRIVREDSQYINQEIVVPAIVLLSQPGFAGAEEEFLRAHQLYRKGDYREAIVVANSAFESTMKSIFSIRKWEYESTASAQRLLEGLFAHGLIPGELQAQFGALRSVMESGAPTMRNKPGRGHGQGPTLLPVPRHLAAYVLHLVAANIVLLVEAHRQAS